MEFTVGDYVRMGFGFANPNHAAAFLCALLPFCWGWKSCAWAGRTLTALLLMALALTFSRTGFAVLALEWIAWRLVSRTDPADVGKRAWPGWALAFAVALLGVWWMSPRLSLDGAVMNRPRIWLAGFELLLANPRGVGFGNSGLLASSFLLPDGVEVRTMVNSHLTLLVEEGWAVGCAWLVFIASALACGRCWPRIRIAFGGLTLSACVSSVFDWHVLFSGEGVPRYGMLNGVLSWFLLALFLSMGLFLVIRGFGLQRALGSAAGVFAATGALLICRPAEGTPRVSSGFVEYGKGGPLVLHDGEWGLKAIRRHLPEGAVIRIQNGTDDRSPESVRKIWLFGDVAESSDRFPDAEVTVVGAPAFYAPGPNVKKSVSEEEWTCR